MSTEGNQQQQQPPPPIALSCSQCNCTLAGCRYVLLDNKQPACLNCFDTRLANICTACGEKIGCDSKDVSYSERHWHEACFRCAGCSVQLAGSSFSVKSDSIYCLLCYETRFAERCSKCRQAFKAGQRKFEFRGSQFHEACFLCCECGAQIGGASFVPRGGANSTTEQRQPEAGAEPTIVDCCCMACYEAKFAQRCADCREVIRKGGVSYKGRPYHADCLVCGHCAKPLCGSKFASHEEKPYCADCYGELFAKRCSACSKPITGFTGSKFISFEQRDWHSQCFNCANCSDSLVGKGFLADGEKVVCTRCGGAASSNDK